MLIEATPDDLLHYGDLAYRLAQNPVTSCYPTYGDGTKTRTEFDLDMLRAIKNSNAELLIFSINGAVEGLISYDWLPEDRYLQLNAFCIRRSAQQALNELIERITARFPGYTAYFGFSSDNQSAVRFLAANGFDLIEQTQHFVFHFGGELPQTICPGIERITRENFDLFRAIYPADEQTYWNADRIYDALDRWIVLLARGNGAPRAAIFLTGHDAQYEIFGTAFADDEFSAPVLRDLLLSALHVCRNQGAKHLIYLCQEIEKPVLAALGFAYIGEYHLYVKALGE